jgi:hypothetical protein
MALSASTAPMTTTLMLAGSASVMTGACGTELQRRGEGRAGINGAPAISDGRAMTPWAMRTPQSGDCERSCASVVTPEGEGQAVSAVTQEGEGGPHRPQTAYPDTRQDPLSSARVRAQRRRSAGDAPQAPRV